MKSLEYFKFRNVIIGIIAGIVSGLFSTGGGMILVPAFIYLLKIDDTKSRGTSVFCILPMVLASSIFYYKGNYIDWKIAVLCAIGGAIGGYIGAKLLKKLPEKILKITFTGFLIYVSVRMITS
jgi:uncharacterized membrane protein YfcA